MAHIVQLSVHNVGRAGAILQLEAFDAVANGYEC